MTYYSIKRRKILLKNENRLKENFSSNYRKNTIYLKWETRIINVDVGDKDFRCTQCEQ